ncbi:TPA: response regulator [bacterium]|nr:response regulator [bacterium]
MNKQILFIEDDKFLLDQLHIALKDYYDIIPASSAIEGLEALEKMNFDAVILDIMMPPPDDIDAELVGYGRTTGIEICRRIKNIKPDLPVIILSVVRDPGILDRISNAGADAIINKPALPSKIDEVIRKVLNQEVFMPDKDFQK